MSNTSFYLYDGALEFQCAQDSNRIKLTAKTTKHFSAKIKANTASGNSMNYGSSGGSTMNMVFGTSDFPIQFDVTNDALGVESFSLDSECQMKIKPSA